MACNVSYYRITTRSISCSTTICAISRGSCAQASVGGGMKLEVLCVAALVCCGGMAAAAQRPQLLPEPQIVEYGAGSIPVKGLTIRFSSKPSAEDRFSANELVRG